MTTYHRHPARATAALQQGKHDMADRRARQERERQDPIVTAQARERVMQLALDDPEKFVRMCRLSRVISLHELPWWAEFAMRHVYEATVVMLNAREAGIRVGR